MMDWKTEIKSYEPINEQETKDKALILRCIETFPDILTRENEIAHLTSSAFVINTERTKMLMIYHNQYDSWSWVGGHADGEEDLWQVAKREAEEETGVQNLTWETKELYALDVLTVFSHQKKGKFVSSHLHLSATYLFLAEESEPLRIKADENSGVKWVPFSEVKKCSSEPHMLGVYEKLIKRLEDKNVKG